MNVRLMQLSAMIFVLIRSLIGKAREVFANFNLDRMDLWTIALIFEVVVLYVVLEHFA